MCFLASSFGELLMSHSRGVQGKLIGEHHVFLANFRELRFLRLWRNGSQDLWQFEYLNWRHFVHHHGFNHGGVWWFCVYSTRGVQLRRQHADGVCGYGVRGCVWAGLTSAQYCLSIFCMASFTCLTSVAGPTTFTSEPMRKISLISSRSSE